MPLQDHQLWFEDADCLVHFCSPETSQRSASLRVPYEAVKRLNCHHLTENCLRICAVSPSIADGDTDTPPADHDEMRGHAAEKELYIPAPVDFTREQAYAYHITTRNFLAYAVGAPLVGERLSTALVTLWQRFEDWHLPAPLSGFTAYLDTQGYSHFAENAEHALACLNFAEAARLRDIWQEAFAHCVGMHERLDLSPEYAGLSRTSAAAITRASLEMDLHISRVKKATSSFLDEELGADSLGLSKPARDHLDHFRSFLYGFYVDKLGYFPPREGLGAKRRPWQGIYQDFQHLYDYLADNDSSCDWTSGRGLTGGICVIQNVRNFDARHGYSSLPHPLPLLPHLPKRTRRSLGSQTALKSLKLARANSVLDTASTATLSLDDATNSCNPDVLASPCVKAYQQFENQRVDVKLDVIEARKVRWLLIYGVLQLLTSVFGPPKLGPSTLKLSYSLCAMTNSSPPWADADDYTEERLETPAPISGLLVPEAQDDAEGRSSRISIHPDCEADNAYDYFAANTISRRDSHLSLSTVSTPLKTHESLTKTGSFRSSMHSSVQALQKSVVGSLTRRSSSRRGSIILEPERMSSCREMVTESPVDESEAEIDFKDESISVHSDTDGLWLQHPSQTPIRTASPAEIDESLFAFNFDFTPTDVETVLDQSQLDGFADELDTVLEDPEDYAISPSESEASSSSYASDDRGYDSSSYIADDELLATDLSSVDGDSSKRDSADSDSSALQAKPLPRQSSYRAPRRGVAFQNVYAGVNGGCYRPSGLAHVTTSQARAC